MNQQFTYTSNGNNKWGIVASGRKNEYVEKKTHNVLALLVLSLPLIPIAAIIITHMPK